MFAPHAPLAQLRSSQRADARASQGYPIGGKSLNFLIKEQNAGRPIAPFVGTFIVQVGVMKDGKEGWQLFEMVTGDIDEEIAAEFKMMQSAFDVPPELRFLLDRKEIIVEFKAAVDAGYVPVADFFGASIGTGAKLPWPLHAVEDAHKTYAFLFEQLLFRILAGARRPTV